MFEMRDPLHGGEPVRLTEAQRRHFGVFVTMLEETLVEVEAIAAAREASTRMVQAEHDLPASFQDALAPALARIRERLYVLAALVGAEARTVSDARRVQAHLVTSIVHIEETVADKLRGYGEVDPGIAARVDPVLRDLHRELSGLAALVAPAARRGA